MKILILTLFILSSAFANFDAELGMIHKFKKDEYSNSANYIKDGKQELLTKEFHSKIKNDPKLLRYFFANYVAEKFDLQLENDAEYFSYIRRKFGTSSISAAQKITVRRMLGNLVFSDTEENLKNMLSDEFDRNSLEYFKYLMKKLDDVRFK